MDATLTHRKAWGQMPVVGATREMLRVICGGWRIWSRVLEEHGGRRDEAQAKHQGKVGADGRYIPVLHVVSGHTVSGQQDLQAGVEVIKGGV